jgi:CBS domain-containing protein
MGTLRSCDHLRHEHRLIGQVVAGIDALTERRRSGANVPTLPVTGAVDFFSGYVAGCHDVKEDEALLPAAAACGAADDALVRTLRQDHEEGDRLLGALRPLLSRHRVDGEAWSLLEAYLALLRRHITTEDGDLLPLVDQLLSPEDDAAVERAFHRIEERALGRAGSEALVALAGAVAHASSALASEPPEVPAPLVAGRIMRPTHGTLTSDDSLARAAELMATHAVRELPVVSGRALVGILTRTDMEPHRGHFEWTAVRDAMTPDPVSVTPDTSVRAVARQLFARGFNALPVTTGGDLVGMVARADVISVLARDG